MNSLNHYPIVFLLYTIEIFGVISFILIYLSKKDKPNLLIFDPLIFFIFGSSFIYLVIPWLMYINDWSWHNISYQVSSYIYANIYVYLYIFLVVAFYMLFYKQSYKKIKAFNLENNYYKLSSKQNFILILFFLIPILIDTIYLLKYIFSFDFAYYLTNRIILRKGMGLIILVSYMGTLVVPIFFANILLIFKKKNKIKFIIAIMFFTIFILLPFLVSYVVMGNRLTALILLIMLIMIYLVVMQKKFTFLFYIKMLFSGLGLFIFFAIIGYLRGVQGDIDKVDFSFLFELLGEQSRHALVGNFGNFEHLVWLFDHNHDWEILYGETYVAAFLNLIPRFLWSDKLLGGGPHLKNIIEPGSYDLSGENITSYTTGTAIESYMNFDIFGVIVLAFFHAMMLIFLKKISFKIRGNIILLSIYLYLLFGISFLLMFGEFLGIFTRTLVVSMPFILFYLFTKKSKHNSYIVRGD